MRKEELKVGMKVRLGKKKIGGCVGGFNPDMYQYLGKVVTVSEIYSSSFGIEEDGERFIWDFRYAEKEAPKFKAGDRVRVKKSGTFNKKEVLAGYVWEMDKFLGKVVTLGQEVKGYDRQCFRVEEDAWNYTWDSVMFEPIRGAVAHKGYIFSDEDMILPCK